MTLQANSTVMIYQDPVTQLKPEGRAKLIKCLSDDPELPQWLVHFVGDEPGEQYPRGILKD